MTPIPKLGKAGRRRRPRPVPELSEDEVREAVLRRAGWTCEARLEGCEDARRLGFHHRYKPGRVDTFENLLLVCQSCHTDSPAAIHRNVAWSETVGLLLRSSAGLPAAAWTRNF